MTRVPTGGARAPPAPVATLEVSVEAGGVVVGSPGGVAGFAGASGGARFEPPTAEPVAPATAVIEPSEPAVVALVVPTPAATTLGGPAAGGTTAVAEMIGAAAAASLGTTPATVGALTLVVSVGVGSAFAERTGAGGGGGGGLAAATTAAGSADTVDAFTGVTVSVVEVWSMLKNLEEVALACHVLGSSAVVAGSAAGAATVAGAGLEFVDPGRLVGTVPMLSVTTAPYSGPVALVCPVFCFGERTRSVTTGTNFRCWGIQKRR